MRLTFLSSGSRSSSLDSGVTEPGVIILIKGFGVGARENAQTRSISSGDMYIERVYGLHTERLLQRMCKYRSAGGNERIRVVKSGGDGG
jgi:hypothetical protein